MTNKPPVMWSEEDSRNPNNRHVTFDQRTIYFPFVKKEEICPHAIAYTLGMICRYNGFVRRFYSVAEHSVLVCELAEIQHPGATELIKCALLHDAPEAYLGDISRPLKRLLPDYQRLERIMHETMVDRFDLTRDPAVWDVVSTLDMQALQIEANHLLFHRYPWVGDEPHVSFNTHVGWRIRNQVETDHRAASALLIEKLKQYKVM